MISLLASALLSCVPLPDADHFGEIRFDERVSADDARFALIECDEDGCTGFDKSGVQYQLNGEWLLQKITDGRGPSAGFEARLVPDSPGSQVLTAPICVADGGMWLTLDLTIPDRPVYRLFAQP